MAQSLQSLLDAPIIELDTIDSTNNYAMRLIDADTAQPGLTIVTASQTQGKGQRGRQWQDEAGQSLLMSVIISPGYSVDRQFLFNVAVTVAIADALQNLHEGWDVRVKWPNDIIINDKKAGGILIENVLRGSNWMYSVLGFGLNIHQEIMPEGLPYSTSLFIASRKHYEIMDVCSRIRTAVLEQNGTKIPDAEILQRYNDYLYRSGKPQRFYNDSGEWEAIISQVMTDGRLEVILPSGEAAYYIHGTVNWKWE